MGVDNCSETVNPTEVDYTRCQYHQFHETKRIHVDLSKHKLGDVPKIPERFNKTLELTVMDWSQYSDDTFSRYDFCPGQDVVSYCLDVQRIWEPTETLAVLDVLQQSGLVVEAGCHLGYYAALAVASGCDFVGVETNEELAALTVGNVATNRTWEVSYSEIALGLVETLTPRPVEPIRLFIADVEGQEQAAVDYVAASFQNRTVDYALLEMSPIFNDTYPSLTERLIGWGYVGFVIPHKGTSLQKYGERPLDILKSTEPVTPELVAGWRQENCLFVHPDLV